MNFTHAPHEIIRVGERTVVIYSWGSLTEETKPRVWENVECFDSAGQKIWTIHGMENCP